MTLKYTIIVLGLIDLSACQPPNVCNTFADYMTMDPKKCWYSPNLYLDAPDLIKSEGYPFQEYDVTTGDDYILKVFRIPKNKSRGVVFIQHPASTTCTPWIDKGNESLAFMLWDAGYDVWLGNFRGTYYSRKHKYLNPNERGSQYWNFSFNEMGVYDIHDQLDFVINVTKPKDQGIALIAHSMGSTSALIYAIEYPEHAKKWLNVMILGAPSAYMNHAPNYMKQLSKTVNQLYTMGLNLNLAEIVAHNSFFATIQGLFCKNGATMFLCLAILNFISGYSNHTIAAKYVPIAHSQYPGGLSLKCFAHYLQIINADGQFQQFDYGDKNMEYYHSIKPPQYAVDKISVPVYLVYGDKDIIIPIEDIDYLYNKLQPSTKIYRRWLVNEANHVYFLYGEHVSERIYKPLIQFLNKLFT